MAQLVIGGFTGSRSSNKLYDRSPGDLASEDDSQDDTSSRSGPNTDTLSTASEPSLTSPLGLSLHSLGSPCSPMQPQPAAHSHDDWTPNSNSFRSTFPGLPLPVTAGLTSGKRLPVGTDPRDLKNPLSVWQLTGKSTPDRSSVIGAGVADGRRFHH